MLARILFVDDEPDMEALISQRFRRVARQQKIDLMFASNGIEALEKLQNNAAVDVLLTDINMPQMDGLTLLSEVGHRYPLLKSIVVSAYGDMANIRTALNRGAFDFLTKPIDFTDLVITVDKAITAAKSAQKAEQDRKELVAVQRELDVAHRIQTSMLPEMAPFADRSDVEIFAQMIPAREVGGDFYDPFPINDHKLGFVVGDVSGKGVPAALFMALCRTLLKIAAMEGEPPDTCLTNLNRSLCSEHTSGTFVTLLYGILDSRTGTVTYANGGHNSPFLIRSGIVESIRKDGTGGTILGAIPNLEFDSDDVVLSAGDWVVLYTDGVTEARDNDQNLFGEERLAAKLESLVSGSVRNLVEEVLNEVALFSENNTHADDITVFAMRYLGTG